MNKKEEALPNVPNSERQLVNEQYKDKDIVKELQSEIQAIERDFEENKRSNSNTIGLFKIQTANEWIKQAELRPIPKMLFSEFWHEGEVCILYADTNLGKSILAVQIANSISKGIPIPSFKLEATPQKVLYFDFELTDKQFQNRYSIDYQNSYEFSQNLFRIEIDPDYDIADGLTIEDCLNNSIESSIKETGAKILMIDNITYLSSQTEKAKDALPLMKSLKILKNKYNLSLLVLAHTPKRDQSKPITGNDLQGSKHLMNFCDSAFSIGKSSNDNSIKYLKMIKARNTEIIYDGDNICECHISKPDNFLKFEFLNYGKESHHLRIPSDKDKEDLENQISEMLIDEPELSSYAIAQRLCTDNSKFNSFKVKVNRIVKRLSVEE